MALAFAASLVATRPTSRVVWLAAGLAASAGVGLLLAPGTSLLDGLRRTWVVLVAVTFAACLRLRPAPFWSLALRACLYAGAGLAVLGPVTAGVGVWQEARWEATRDASAVVRRVIERAPGLYPAFEPVVRLVAAGWPVWLLLETVVALALAWRASALVARRPELIHKELRSWK